jgi:hypothetical protein
MNITLLSAEGFLLGLFVTLLFEFVLKSNRKLRNRYYRHHEILFGYHVHHSTFGLLAIVISLLLFMGHQQTHAIFIFWFGVGIIVLHTISDGKFVFIEKQRK